MKIISKKQPKKSANKTLHVALVIDSSGSMSPFVNSVKNYVKEQVDSLTQSKDVDTYLTLYSFNNTTKIVSDYRVNIKENIVDTSSYSPCGGTALSDSIKFVLNQLGTTPSEPSLLLLITDGEDNASSTTKYEINNLISKAISSDYWTIAIAGPKGSKNTITKLYQHIPESCITEWDVSDVGIKDLSIKTKAANQVLIRSVASGSNSSTTYFSPNLQVSKSVIRNSLDDVTTKFSTHTVPNNIGEDERIVSTFVTKKLKKRFTVGDVYYQHTKRETLQDYKNIILRNNDTGKLYSGDEVRNIIGIPDNSTIKLEPAWSNTYTMYIRSTSFNRKLVPGTTILLAKN